MKNQGVSMAGQSENGIRYTEAKYEKICFSCEKPYFPKVRFFGADESMIIGGFTILLWERMMVKR